MAPHSPPHACHTRVARSRGQAADALQGHASRTHLRPHPHPPVHARHAPTSHALSLPNPALKVPTLSQFSRNEPEVDFACAQGPLGSVVRSRKKKNQWRRAGLSLPGSSPVRGGHYCELRYPAGNTGRTRYQIAPQRFLGVEVAVGAFVRRGRATGGSFEVDLTEGSWGML